MRCRQKILLVGPKTAEREMMARGLEGEFDLEAVDTLAGALESLDGRSSELLLLILPLPDSRELSGLLKLAAGKVDLPIVVLTETDDEHQSLLALQSGAQDCLEKANLSLTSLRRACRHAIERRRWEEGRQQTLRLEAITRLVGGIAHDFNNLLSIINGYSTLLLRELAGQQTARRDAERVLEAGTRAAEMVRRLMAFGRLQVLQPEIIDCNRLIAEVEPSLTSMLPENIRLHILCDSRVCRIKVDPRQLEGVVRELAANACAAMPDGGDLQIETKQVALEETFARRHGLPSHGPHVLLTVRDNGVGMSAALRQQIFDPFFTTGETGRGLGLGLSAAYGIIRQSGGLLIVRSDPGQGSTCEIYLPCMGGGSAFE